LERKETKKCCCGAHGQEGVRMEEKEKLACNNEWLNEEGRKREEENWRGEKWEEKEEKEEKKAGDDIND
jgi:hypothetical protein